MRAEREVGRDQGPTFGTAAYGVVAEASPALLEVWTGRASIPWGHGHLANPLRAANPAW